MKIKSYISLVAVILLSIACGGKDYSSIRYEAQNHFTAIEAYDLLKETAPGFTDKYPTRQSVLDVQLRYIKTLSSDELDVYNETWNELMKEREQRVGKR